MRNLVKSVHSDQGPGRGWRSLDSEPPRHEESAASRQRRRSNRSIIAVSAVSVASSSSRIRTGLHDMVRGQSDTAPAP
jgi:hypothetical protein